METFEVINNPAESRYEVHVDQHMADLSYNKKDSQTIFIHTNVPPSLEGQGIGSALARQALQDSLDEGRWQIPLCPFVRGYVIRHPDYQDSSTFYQVLAELDEANQELLILARSLIVESVPERVVEIAMPREQIVGYAEKGGRFTDNLCWLAVEPQGLSLFFSESIDLDDPEGLLQEGSVPIRDPKDLKNPALQNLILAAWVTVE